MCSFYVFISGNSIRETGIAALCECLKINTALCGLNLCSNLIVKTEFNETNGAIYWRPISGNNFADGGIVSISEALKMNSTLVRLKLTCKHSGDT